MCTDQPATASTGTTVKGKPVSSLLMCFHGILKHKSRQQRSLHVDFVGFFLNWHSEIQQLTFLSVPSLKQY